MADSAWANAEGQRSLSETMGAWNVAGGQGQSRPWGYEGLECSGGAGAVEKAQAGKDCAGRV
eukprot:356215-Chlamydomonas_euryale.AAC.2